MILLQHAYLPTFAQDALPEVRRVLGGSFYGNIQIIQSNINNIIILIIQNVLKDIPTLLVRWVMY